MLKKFLAIGSMAGLMATGVMSVAVPAASARPACDFAVESCGSNEPPAVPAGVATYITQLYAEALGRAPDQAGFDWMMQDFRINGCTAAMVRSYGAAFYLSAEYLSTPRLIGDRVETLYRGLLGRPSDPYGYTFWVAASSFGRFSLPWSTVVNAFVNSDEFTNRIPTICR